MIAFQTALMLFCSLLALLGSAIGSSPAGTADWRKEAAPADGRVAFTYEVRPEVRGNGYGLGIHLQGDHYTYFSGRYDRRDQLVAGPARIVLTYADGRVREVDLAVGRNFPPLGSNTRDLGRVPAAEAADFCLEQVDRAHPDAGEELVLAAAVARDADVTMPLLDIARRRDLASEVRGEAVMWLAMSAGEKIAGTLGKLIDDEDEDFQVRENAVFALAQLPQSVAVPSLIEIARNTQEPRLQRSAVMAMTRFDHAPEVLALLEEILVGE